MQIFIIGICAYWPILWLIFTFICFIFLKVKDAVRDYLPPDEPATRKNPLYRNLFDGFDRIDGKPTEAERKVWIFVEELWLLCYSVINQNIFASLLRLPLQSGCNFLCFWGLASCSSHTCFCSHQKRTKGKNIYASLKSFHLFISL